MNKKQRNNNVTYEGIGLRLVDQMDQITFDRIGQMSISNIENNIKYLEKGQSIGELKRQFGEFDHSIIIAAGPSIKRMNPIEDIKKHGFNGKIVITESALLPKLEVIPPILASSGRA